MHRYVNLRRWSSVTCRWMLSVRINTIHQIKIYHHKINTFNTLIRTKMTMDLATFIDLLAYASGLFFSICLIPQLQIMWANRSATDVSFSWTLLFIIGLIFQVTYLALLGGYIWLSVIPELSLALIVLWSKFYLDSLTAATQTPSKDNYIELSTSDQEENNNDRVVLHYNKMVDLSSLSNSPTSPNTTVKTFVNDIIAIIENNTTKLNFISLHQHVSYSSNTRGGQDFSLVYLLAPTEGKGSNFIIVHNDGSKDILSLDIVIHQGKEKVKLLAEGIHQGVVKKFPNFRRQTAGQGQYQTNKDNHLMV